MGGGKRDSVQKRSKGKHPEGKNVLVHSSEINLPSPSSLIGGEWGGRKQWKENLPYVIWWEEKST